MSVERKTMNGERGVVLLLTMVVLLVLAALGYQLANRVASQRHRDSYIIDYTAACYARDSAIKYALARIQDLNNVTLIDRPNEPDFSDLFAMDEQQYRKVLADWAKELKKKQLESEDTYAWAKNDFFSDDANDEPNEADEDGNETDGDANKADFNNLFADVNDFTRRRTLLDSNGPNDVNDKNEPNVAEPNADELDTIEGLTIRGPYGPPWPLVAEPVDLEIGDVKVKIEIEDENAKYPVGWGILGDEKNKRESEAGLDTFCEWMGLAAEEIKDLKAQLEEISSIKKFQVDFKPMADKTAARPQPAPRRGRRPQRVPLRSVIIMPAEQAAKQARDFSRLFHSSLIDTETLARPTIESDDRKESALKYMGLWGTTQVNINSAPRQVLETAFVFGGDAERIASEIIKKRREKPFAGVEELQKELLGFSTSIEKSAPYIVTASNVFSIHVTATRGAAKASAVIVMFKGPEKIEKIAVASG